MSALARALSAAFSFCWDFVVGDDWLLLAGSVMAIVTTWFAGRAWSGAWVLMPVVVGATLTVSVLRRARRTTGSPR
jgi:hypothetical protein